MVRLPAHASTRDHRIVLPTLSKRSNQAGILETHPVGDALPSALHVIEQPDQIAVLKAREGRGVEARLVDKPLKAVGALQEEHALDVRFAEDRVEQFRRRGNDQPKKGLANPPLPYCPFVQHF